MRSFANRRHRWHVDIVIPRLVLLSVSVALVITGCSRPVENKSEEVLLITEIQKMSPGPERDALIDRLEEAKVDGRTFYDRWIVVHEVMPVWDCWTDDGYDPSKSKIPRNVQILTAACYAKSDIDNGGFHQFFGNEIGTMAPEAAEWLERAGLTGSAAVLREAMNVFGNQFPRSGEARWEFLRKY